jgi:hypothetical protein
VIAATALHYDLPLWTRDGHFAWVQAEFPDLSLFDDSALRGRSRICHWPAHG